jgi:hypothetical protein
MTVTHDPEAERALLGACLIDLAAIEVALPLVTAGDFTTAAHRGIYRALVDAHHAGQQQVDPVEIARSIEEVDVPLAYLHELINDSYSVGLAGRYATRIAEAHVRSRLLHAGSDISSLGNGSMHADDAADAIERARRLLDGIDMPAGLHPPAATAQEYAAAVDQRHHWLIPGFLEHGDRMLVTGGEGSGKSVLAAQIAVQAGAGIHPWTWHRVPPVNALIVDLENGPRLIARRLARLLRAAGPGFDPRRVRIEARQRGINITQPVDRRWLLERCKTNEAQLLVIGPAYRLSSGVASRGDVGGEDAAKAVTDALDDIRDRAGITLLMETHAPHAGAQGRELRPFGSSVWLRWPEFGIALRKDRDIEGRYVVEHWRPDRDRRAWPTYLDQHGETWPWVPFMPHVVPAPSEGGRFSDERLFGGPA